MRDYIIKHFGSITACAKELDVTTVTVRNWMKTNPRGILKHAPEIVASKDTTYLQLQGEVLHREHVIKEIQPTRST
jgi:hypothetical protein